MAEHEQDQTPCDECGEAIGLVWYAPNDLFNRVNGSPNGMICPRCFDLDASAAGEPLVWRADRPHSGPTQPTRPEGEG